MLVKPEPEVVTQDTWLFVTQQQTAVEKKRMTKILTTASVINSD